MLSFNIECEDACIVEKLLQKTLFFDGLCCLISCEMGFDGFLAKKQLLTVRKSSAVVLAV